MKKIACVGYHATGAGVIDDLLREFDNVAQGTYEVESRLLQDPDGISDLEYYLIENPHRLNSGFAIKRYINYVKRTSRSYKQIFGPNWVKISNEYAKSLAAFEFPGYWHGDVWLLNPIWQYYHKFRRGIAKISPKAIRKPSYYNYFPWLKSFHVNLTEEEFYLRTQEYMEKLCAEINKEGKEYVVLDQLINPANPLRYTNYINDLQIIIVDRDPRDVYLHQINHRDHVLPVDVKEFCIEYRDDRMTVSAVSPKQCMHVSFEDLIYKYDISTQKVIDFVGITKEHWKAPQSHFNPNQSVTNTKLWLKTKDYSTEIKYIENELSEWLYQY